MAIPINQPLPNALTRIRDLRIARGWSQEALAQKIVWQGKSVTRQTVDKWEKDQRGLNLEKLTAAAAAFGLSVADLLPKGREDIDPLLPLAPEERRLVEWYRAGGARERTLALVMSHQMNDREAEAFIVRPAEKTAE